MQIQHVQTLSRVDSISGEPLIRVRPSAIMQLLRRLAHGLQTMAEERAHRRAIRELLHFDNRLLADIGIKRCEIEYIVRRGRGAL